MSEILLSPITFLHYKRAVGMNYGWTKSYPSLHGHSSTWQSENSVYEDYYQFKRNLSPCDIVEIATVLQAGVSQIAIPLPSGIASNLLAGWST